MANTKSLSEIRYHLGAVHRALSLSEAQTALESADLAADGLPYGELPADIRAAFGRAELTIGQWVEPRIVSSCM